MKNGKYSKRHGGKRILSLILAMVLVAGLSVGGTLAWLTATSGTVTNTFTVGDINITLAETTENYKIIPGVKIAKDPVVTVEKDSEACWLFVKVEEENWPVAKENDGTRKVEYAIADGWTKLENGIYYREVSASDKNQEFKVLANDEVTVSENLTKKEMEEITTPKLSFAAYAVQKEGISTAPDAWSKIAP